MNKYSTANRRTVFLFHVTASNFYLWALYIIEANGGIE